MTTHVIMFAPQFAQKVELGIKPTTIRGTRKRVINVGDTLSLREWLGKPYRSKQRILRTATCTKVEVFGITGPLAGGRSFVTIERARLPIEEANELAMMDGFTDIHALIEWFRDVHGLPFVGVRIHWDAHCDDIGAL